MKTAEQILGEVRDFLKYWNPVLSRQLPDRADEGYDKICADIDEFFSQPEKKVAKKKPAKKKVAKKKKKVSKKK